MSYKWNLLTSLLAKTHTWQKVQTFLAGVVLSSLDSLPATVEGQIVHYNKKFYLTSGNRRIISRASQVLVESLTVANTLTETTIFTGSVLANTLTIGKIYKITARGKFSTANANVKLTPRDKLNGATVATLESALGNVTDVAGLVDTILSVRTIGVTGTVSCFVAMELNEKTLIANTSSTVVNTTNGNNMTITAQWDEARVNNIATIDQGCLEALG